MVDINLDLTNSTKVLQLKDVQYDTRIKDISETFKVIETPNGFKICSFESRNCIDMQYSIARILATASEVISISQSSNGFLRFPNPESSNSIHSKYHTWLNNHIVTIVYR